MEVSGLGGSHGGDSSVVIGFTVRNMHHESLEIYI